MVCIRNFWSKLSNNKSLEEANGKIETIFFGKVYRICYVIGLSSVDNNIYYLTYKYTIWLMLLFMIFCEVWFAATKASSLDVIASSVNVILIQMISFHRYLSMEYYRDDYKKLAKSMESPFFKALTKERKELINYWAKKNNRYLELLLLLGTGTLAFWFLYPLLDNVEYNIFISVRTPFYYQTPYRYMVTYLMFMTSFCYVAYFVMVNDLIMQSHLLHLVCQFDILSDCIYNIVKECRIHFKGEELEKLLENKSFVDLYKRRMRVIVNQHRAILSKAIELRYMLSRPMLGHLISSGVLITFIGYQTAITFTENIIQGLMSLFYLVYNLFGFYIVCRWCEEITIQSQRIGEAAYFSFWECGLSKCPGVKSNLMLIKARANKPVIFTAGGMYNLSLNSYASLVKSSYSALTVLLRFRKT